MREGDYYRWSYKQHVIDKRQDSVRAGTLYWCCANIAIFKNGKLRDIYWSSLSEGRSWTQEESSEELELRFVGNADDMEPTHQPEYYDKKDIVDIRHPNMMRGGIYVRKGAKKSRSTIKALVEAKINEAESELKYQERQLERLKEKAVEVETADLDKFYI